MSIYGEKSPDCDNLLTQYAALRRRVRQLQIEYQEIAALTALCRDSVSPIASPS